MSRSYKKTPVTKDRANHSKTRKQLKRVANKKVRKAKIVSNGKAFRKISNTWDIYDYQFYESLQERMKIWEREPNSWRLRRLHSKEEVIHDWRKDHFMK